ncbi:hypothetical protein H4Q26_005134 [Puccinia striiformis f. sp. tritici PST-130]|uniref:Uncharacterized protein n=2 Tax=Puccinia striiformis TaxID=27350 RepID=A0A0L0UVA0_9BASI|nr:hypothetical protein H4Q26_005134 [Puccinia striiformis f. sp. tritici PST-130]KNE90689.1 hypothetical protein PSTG_15898 [Puccinia striiformis f. sp. tritici PST-78]POW01716.1 hypothetical protein PSTT_12303 [Puccinia striiformis]
MPAQKKKNSTATSAALETQTNPPTSTPASKKERSIAWEKDAVNPGFPSMQILLDWIQAPGNFIQWQGKKGIVLEFCLAGVLKKCKYYDDLKEVMAVQANAYPRDMVDSRSDLVPHLLGEDEPDPNEEDRPNPQLASLTGHNANFDESDSDNPREPSTVWNEK